MEKIFIFYGYNKEFSKYIPDTYYPLDTLVEISDIKKKRVIRLDSNLILLLVFSCGFIGFRKGGFKNFLKICQKNF